MWQKPLREMYLLGILFLNDEWRYVLMINKTSK